MSKKGGYYCAFKNCRGLSRRDKRSFFRFPKDPERSKQWVRACNRNDLLEKTPIELFNSYRVCAKHFTDSMFLNDLRNRLQPNSVPTHFSQQQPTDQIQQQLVGNNNETTNSQQQQQIVVAGTTAATTQLVTCNTATANNDFDIVDEAQIQLADCSHDSVAKILSNCVFQKISADEFFKATGICIKEPSSSSEPTNHNIRATTNDDSTATTVEDYLRSSSGNGDCSLSTADHVYSSTAAAANCNEPQLTNNAVDSSSSCYGIKDILVDPSSSSFSIEGLSYQDLMGCSSLQPLSSLIAPIEICGNGDDDDDLRGFSMSRVVGLDDVDRLPDTILEGQEDDDEEVDEDSSSELSNSLESFQPSLQTSVVVDDVDVVVAAACLEAASTASSSSSNASQGNKSTGEACTQTNAYHLLPSDNNKLDKVSQTENDDDNDDKKEPSSPSFHEPRGSSIVSSRDRANKRKLKRILQVKRCEIKSLKSKLLKQNLVELMEHVTLEQYKSLTERFFPKETSDFIKTQAQLFDQEKISQDKQYSLEFKKQCLALFLTGPRTYKNLQKIFCLPAVHDLQTLKF
ncbi:uncharacterized protein LOC106659674 [Trichogramma pretiosum]|uniref:uncharacterized protein LOC106659674 n=1 Tax=Trichogramma pretiosum TaxID=7493 RepID=UPI0006C9AAA7|nr:uncharacterized protein LOC106659674 [Trichogramma pretiosum]